MTKVRHLFLALGDNAKFCKVRRVSPLIMSEKKVFSIYKRHALPIPTGLFAYTNAARCACKKGVRVRGQILCSVGASVYNI